MPREKQLEITKLLEPLSSIRHTTTNGKEAESTDDRDLSEMKKGRIASPLYNFTCCGYCCGSSSTPSPTCTGSMAKTIMPVAVPGVVLSTTISPTARRGMSEV